MNLFFSPVAGQWAGVGRGFFLFYTSHLERNFNRIAFTVLACSFSLLQNIFIFPFFLILPLAWEYTNEDGCFSSFCVQCDYYFFLIRQVHPSFRRRRLRKGVRPLPVLFLWGWIWWPAIKVSWLQSTVKYHRLYNAHVYKSSFLRVHVPASNRVRINTTNNFMETFLLLHKKVRHLLPGAGGKIYDLTAQCEG